MKFFKKKAAPKRKEIPVCRDCSYCVLHHAIHQCSAQGYFSCFLIHNNDVCNELFKQQKEEK